MILEDYTKIIEKFPVYNHSVYLIDSFNKWIKENGLKRQNFDIHAELVKQVSLNLFVDIRRIKEFHKMEEVNSKKFAAYQAFWILKIRPIQLTGFEEKNRKYYVLANELFALQTVMAHLYDISIEKFLNAKELRVWTNFLKKVVYHFHHRIVNAQALELAFEAIDLTPPHPKK